jgi:hypothetical protein
MASGNACRIRKEKKMNRFKSIKYAGLFVLLFQLCMLLASSNAYGKDCNIYLVTGIKDVAFDVGVQQKGDRVVDKEIEVALPEIGADTLAVSLKGFALYYGSFKSSRLIIDTTSILGFGLEDHHLGLELISVRLASMTTQHAKIDLRALLRDAKGDDRWGGIVTAQIIFLKCFSKASTPSTPFIPPGEVIDTLRVRVDSLFQLLNKK